MNNSLNNSMNNSNARTLLREAEAALLDEKRDLTPEELTDLAALSTEHVASLARLAHEVRVDRCGLEVELEGILSAKTGGCTEDCSFCSQSARYDSPVKATPFLDMDEVRKAAQSTASLGASKFCLVLAIKGPDSRTLARILEAVTMVREETGLQVAVSAGLLDDDQAEQLAKAGVHCYNHNIETARSFFPNIVTSHTWEERVENCKRIKSHGMELCSGVLLGMGESNEQRLEMILQLRDLEPTDVPINFLNPRPGTPLELHRKVPAWEAIRWIAIFRLGLPTAILRYAGGREVTLRELQAMGLASGINALIVGNYLTTLGRDASTDIEMLQDMAMPVGIIGTAI
ncbi:MAG: biotin synthase BioB [Acidimicrobiales bacterium]